MTTGEVVHRDLGPYLNGFVLDLIRTDEAHFREVRAEDRSLVLPGGAAVERGKSVPLGRMGLPEDLAGPTVFLATEDAKYITGICLAADGGVLVQQRSVPVDTFPLSRFPKIESEPGA